MLALEPTRRALICAASLVRNLSSILPRQQGRAAATPRCCSSPLTRTDCSLRCTIRLLHIGERVGTRLCHRRISWVAAWQRFPAIFLDEGALLPRTDRR